MSNREQQRQNARDQRRLERRQKLRQGGQRPAMPPLGKRVGPKAPTPIAAREPQRRLLPSWWPWAAAGAVLVLVVALFVVLDPFGLRKPLEGTKLASQGNSHVNAGETHVAYSTDPPASGPHFPTVPRRGTYLTPFATEFLPHFLEHAGVEVQYNKSAPDDVVKKLTDIVNKELDRTPGLVLLAPRPDMPCQVALTSWQHIETFGTPDCQPGSVGHELDPKSSSDASKVTSFIERNMCGYDPENQCGGGAHGALKYATPKPGEPTVTASLGTATPAPGATPNAPAATATPAP